MNLIKKITNTFLALSLLVGTTGMTLNKHYCMGHLKSVAVNESAHSCVEKGFTDPMPCCEDVSEELRLEEITQVNFDFDAQTNLYELAVISFVLDAPSISKTLDRTTFQDYSPPLPDDDLQVAHQLFLI